MALHVCILGIDGSGKSTVVDTLPDMLAGLAGVRVASVGERHRVADPEQTILAPGFHPGGVPFTARIAQGFKWASKRCTASLRVYPVFKVLQLAFQDAAARRLESRYRPDVVVSDGNLILSVVGRAVNYLQPARTDTKAVAWDVDSANVREAFAQLDGVIPASGWTRILTGLAQTLRRFGFHILWLPDVVILLDLKPETAMHRISARGGRIDPHENLADLTRARRMYVRTLKALTTCRGKADLICVPVDHLSPGEVMRAVSEQVQRYVDVTEQQRSDDETLGRLEGTKAAWRSFLNAGYLGKCLVTQFFRGTWREPLFPLSKIGRRFMTEGYSASVMQAIYDQDQRSSLLERAFNGYPLHRAVYDRLQLLVPRITQELIEREGRVRILSAPCGLAEDVFRSVARAKDSAQDGVRDVDFTAVDLDPNGRIATAVRERGLSSGVDVRFVKGDLTDPATWSDILDGPFDIALFVGLKGWLPKPDLLEHLVRLRNCLRDDGVLLTDVFTAGPYALSGWYAGYRAHYYEPAVFASLLEASGFDPASVSVASGRDGLNHVMVCRPKPREIRHTWSAPTKRIFGRFPGGDHREIDRVREAQLASASLP